MAFYVKVTKEISDFLGNTENYMKSADGCVLRWQADFNNIPGTTLSERAAKVGGAVLTPYEAVQERDGVGNIHVVSTPDEYTRKKVDNTNKKED